MSPIRSLIRFSYGTKPTNSDKSGSRSRCSGSAPPRFRLGCVSHDGLTGRLRRLLIAFSVDGCAQGWQDFGRCPPALFFVREAGQDELVDAQTPVGEQLARDLLRVTDDGRPQVHPYLRDAVPQPGRAIPQLLAQLGLLPDHRCPLESGPPLRDDALIGARYELFGRVPGLSLGGVHYEMGSSPEDGGPA